MEQLEQFAANFAGYIWSTPLFLLLLGCGIIFSLVTKFIQYRVMTHGINVIRGQYDKPEDTGHINHFQALCAALSATIGLGNIGGVAIAVQIGGPGAIFWMWVVGLFGMSIKFVECGLATMFRREENEPRPGKPDGEKSEVQGGPMWYMQKGLAEPARQKGKMGRYAIFRFMALLFATLTFACSFGSGNSFQAWNVADLMETQFRVPGLVTGVVLAGLVGLVIIGGIKRIGNVAGKLVPLMCAAYVVGAFYIIAINAGEVPAMLASIVKCAFNPTSAGGAFLGSTFTVAFTQGLRRALFSNEAGQGSAAIAHAAAKTDEPIREGLVAGIGPFIDTIIICTMTALVIMAGGAYTRPELGTVTAVDERIVTVAINEDVQEKLQRVYAAEIENSKVVNIWLGEKDQAQGSEAEVVQADVVTKNGAADNWMGSAELFLDAAKMGEENRAQVAIGSPVHLNLDGASMTRFAFDTGFFGLGKVMVTLGVILFAFSTMISWSYYGERGAEFVLGPKFILVYKVFYLVVIFLSCQIPKFSIVYDMSDALCGAMVLVNLPAALLLFPRYLRAAKDYMGRLDRGEMPKVK